MTWTKGCKGCISLFLCLRSTLPSLSRPYFFTQPPRIAAPLFLALFLELAMKCTSAVPVSIRLFKKGVSEPNA
jgi:hypothetical protein